MPVFNDIIILYDSPFQIFQCYPKSGFYEEIWKPESINLEEDSYKQEFLNLLPLTNRFPIPYNKLLIDHREFLFAITPELQSWHAQNIFSKLGDFVSGDWIKTANIVAKDFVSQLSIEQTFDEPIPFESREIHLQNYFFANRDEALSWLLGQNFVEEECESSPLSS